MFFNPMTSPDLKKLITGFLVLATAASSFAFLFSGLLGTSTGTPDKRTVVGSKTGSGTPLIGPNAFVEPIPQSPSPLTSVVEGGGAVSGGTESITAAPSDNLTENLARKFADEVLENNPEGPQVAEGGGQTLNLPTEEYLAQMIAETIAGTPLKLEKNVSPEDISVLANYTADDIGKYFDAVNAVLDKHAANPKFAALLQEEPSTETVNATHLVLSQTVGGLRRVPVPQPLTALHRRLLGLFMNQEAIFAAAAQAERDPLRTLVAIEEADRIIDRDLNNLQNEFQKTDLQKIISEQKDGGGLLSFLRDIMGIRKARAFVFHDPVSNTTRIVEWIKDGIKDIKKWIYDTVLRTTVNILINRLQNQVVNWIAGNGKPMFVTNWKQFLSQAGNEAAGLAIQKIVPGLCTSFGPLMQIALRQPANVYDQTWCTLGDIERNIRTFYNDFQSGSWVSYGAILDPRNNFYGNLILTSDLVIQEAAAARTAAEREASASQGFKGPKRCVASTTVAVQGPLLPGQTRPMQEVCTQWETVTPGSAVGETLFGSLNWKPNQIVSAKRLAELVGAIIDAAVNRMIQRGLAALTQAMNPSEGSVSTDESEVTTVEGVTVPGGVSGIGGIDDIKSNAEDLVDARAKMLRDALTANNQWLAMQPEAIGLLGQVASQCPSLAGSANAHIATLAQLVTTVQGENGNLDTLIKQLDGLKLLISSATSAAELEGLRSQAMEGSEGDAGRSATSQGRLNDLTALKANAQANLPASCATPL